MNLGVIGMYLYKILLLSILIFLIGCAGKGGSETYYQPVPRNTPPVQDPAVYDPRDIFPQEYRYSGVSRNGFSWGRMTIDPDGHYSGWDSKGGYIRGQIQE